jgi:NAD(P)-dependent dehydrogenase (short-subunit alcohol dehydrogenase family)
MSIWIDLSSDVAVVFGGGSGIGEGIAAALATAGAKVAVVDASIQAANTVAEQITNKGGIAVGIEVELPDAASVQNALDVARDHFGPTSVLVSSTATWSTAGELTATAVEDSPWATETGLTSAAAAMRSALPDLLTTRGTVVNVALDCARTGGIYLSAQASAGAGIVAATKSFAREVGRRGVRANTVTSGTMVTPNNTSLIDHLGGAERLARAYPLGRLGTPADVANAVLFLTSPLAAWITGQTLAVNGGHTMY